MSMSNSAEAAALALLFNNTNWSNLGDATGLRGSTSAGFFYVSAATADPGETGTQLTSEATYTGYARAPVVRSVSGWTVSGTAPTQASNAGSINLGACIAADD